MRRRYLYKDYEIDIFTYESLGTWAVNVEVLLPRQTVRVSVATHAQTGFKTEAHAEEAVLMWAEDDIDKRPK